MIVEKLRGGDDGKTGVESSAATSGDVGGDTRVPKRANKRNGGKASAINTLANPKKRFGKDSGQEKISLKRRPCRHSTNMTWDYRFDQQFYRTLLATVP